MKCSNVLSDATAKTRFTKHHLLSKRANKQNMSDIFTVDNFITLYEGDNRRIRFAWNGKHADDFEDANETFRAAVLARLLAHPELAPLPLVRDVFVAETACRNKRIILQ